MCNCILCRVKRLEDSVLAKSAAKPTITDTRQWIVEYEQILADLQTHLGVDAFQPYTLAFELRLFILLRIDRLKIVLDWLESEKEAGYIQ